MNSEQILRTIYYNPKNPAGFSSVDPLYKEAKKVDNSITKNFVKDWLSGEFTYTLHKPVRKKFKRNPIIVRGIDDQWEADLVDLQEFSTQNSGYRYILTVIDIFSKYAWVQPLFNKTSGSIINAFKTIFNNGRKPKFLRTDQGREFLNQYFKSFMNRENVVHFTSNNRDIKCAVVERFNRTLKSRMFKYFTSKGTRKYVNILNDLVSAYNNSYHRSIKMRPIDVNQYNSQQVFYNIYGVQTINELKQKRSKALLTPKTLVRKQYIFNPFDKSYYPNWTDQIYEVTTFKSGPNKTLYSISDETSQRYYPEQLQKVKNNLYRVEKIIRSRIVKGKKQYFVKWLGYPSNYNSWIDNTEIVKL